jgi:hypothetical protein
MQGVWPHLLRFLSRVWAKLLAWHSATTFSVVRETIIIPLVIVLLTLIVILYPLRKEKWWKWDVLKTLQDRIGEVFKSLVIVIISLFVLLIAVFMAAVPVVVYQDHNNFLSAIRILTAERDDWKKKATQPALQPAKPAYQLAHIHITKYELEYPSTAGKKMIARVHLRNDGPPLRVAVSYSSDLIRDLTEYNDREKFEESLWDGVLKKVRSNKYILTLPSGDSPFLTMESIRSLTEDDIAKLRSDFVYYFAVVILDEQRRPLLQSCFCSDPKSNGINFCIKHN